MLNVTERPPFLRLHENARKSEGYTRPFFLGIEHLAQDHSGSISWKGVVVDHFDHGFWRLPGWQDRMKAVPNNSPPVAESLKREASSRQ